MELRGQSQEKSVELESLVGHGKNTLEFIARNGQLNKLPLLLLEQSTMSPAPGVTRRHSATVVSKAEVRGHSPEVIGQNIPRKREGILPRKNVWDSSLPSIVS